MNKQLKIDPRIETGSAKKLIGTKIKMSLSNNKTTELWRGFMPRRQEIQNVIGIDLYSIQIFYPDYFKEFNPAAEFENWAAVEVTDFGNIPDQMESILLPGGLYAVFLYMGCASDGPITFRYIYQTWLPNSEYVLDDRPHFEIMGEKYKNDAADSEEEFWIPIKPKP